MATEAPTLLSFEEASARLLSPGSPFELTEEVVLGETMQVYKARARSLRQILEQSAAHGDKVVVLKVNVDREKGLATRAGACGRETTSRSSPPTRPSGSSATGPRFRSAPS